MSHDCTTCQACGYCDSSEPHYSCCDPVSGPDAEGTAPTPEPAPPGIPGWTIETPEPCPDSFRLHVPARGNWLVIDGKAYRVHPDGAYVQMEASWRVRWAVTTDPKPLERP